MRFTKKIIWLLVSCLMVASLAMASCGTAAEEETEIETETKIEKKTETKEEEEKEVVSGPEKPEYGGTITIALGVDISNWANGLEMC